VYWFIFRPNERGVHVALWRGDEILLVRNSYRRGLGLPSGGLRRGERATMGAIRELREEVGIEFEESRLSYAGDFESRDQFKLDRSTVFEVELRADDRIEPRPDRREVVAAGFVDFRAALEAPLLEVLEQYLTRRAAERGSAPGDSASARDAASEIGQA
jgi:ADP-ribose pyrophosphatase YjhB (NUDIX family)